MGFSFRPSLDGLRYSPVRLSSASCPLVILVPLRAKPKDGLAALGDSLNRVFVHRGMSDGTTEPNDTGHTALRSSYTAHICPAVTVCRGYSLRNTLHCIVSARQWQVERSVGRRPRPGHDSLLHRHFQTWHEKVSPMQPDLQYTLFGVTACRLIGWTRSSTRTARPPWTLDMRRWSWTCDAGQNKQQAPVKPSRWPPSTQVRAT